MSSEAIPITPARFAAALTSLPLVSLRLKCLELRNSILHLAHSNEDLQPYADGRRTAIGSQAPGVPDQDCIDAIRENNLVIERMMARIELLKAEVERRGVSWSGFELNGADGAGNEDLRALLRTRDRESGLSGGGYDDDDDEDEVVVGGALVVNGNEGLRVEAGAGAGAGAAAGGPAVTEERNPWTDGTFQTGSIRNGQLHMDEVHSQGTGAADGAPVVPAAATAASSTSRPMGEGQEGAGVDGFQVGELRRVLEPISRDTASTVDDGRVPDQVSDVKEDENEEEEEEGEGVYL